MIETSPAWTRASILNVAIDEQGSHEIAKRGRGTPRIVNRLLRRVRDYAEVKADGNISRPVADAALIMLDVDSAGLDISSSILQYTAAALPRARP